MGDADNNAVTPDTDTTEIEVVISDLINSDGMAWTDADGDDMVDDPIVKSITFGSRTSTQLVSFTTVADDQGVDVPTNTLAAEARWGRRGVECCRIRRELRWHRHEL